MARAVWIEDSFANRPGRAEHAARIAAACAIVTIVSMTFGVPEVPLSCYLIFFASKEGQTETAMTALKLIAAATGGGTRLRLHHAHGRRTDAAHPGNVLLHDWGALTAAASRAAAGRRRWPPSSFRSC